jgi:hypothetical protein
MNGMVQKPYVVATYQSLVDEEGKNDCNRIT